MNNETHALLARIFMQDETGTFVYIDYRCPKCRELNERILFTRQPVDWETELLAPGVECSRCNSESDIVFSLI